jgi:hypothetical protein
LFKNIDFPLPTLFHDKFSLQHKEAVARCHNNQESVNEICVAIKTTQLNKPERVLGMKREERKRKKKLISMGKLLLIASANGEK